MTDEIPHEKTAGKNYGGFLGVAIAATIWGSNGVIINSVPLPSATVAFLRVLFATMSLLAGIAVTGKWRLLQIHNSWRSLIALGALLGTGWILFFQSMKLIPIAETVLLNYTGPVFAALLAPFLLNEVLGKRASIPLALSMIGIFLISLPQIGLGYAPQRLLGDILGLAAGLLYAIFIIVSKKTLKSVSSYSVAFYSYLFASIILSPSIFSANISLDLASWCLLLILGVLNTGVAVTLYFSGLRVLKTHEAVVITYLEPVSAMVFGYLFLSQSPTITMLIGGSFIILAGCVLAINGREKPKSLNHAE